MAAAVDPPIGNGVGHVGLPWFRRHEGVRQYPGMRTAMGPENAREPGSESGSCSVKFAAAATSHILFERHS
jgi:hypothetical protein